MKRTTVLTADNSHCVGVLPITTCTPCFLVVFFERRRHCQVNDQAYIGLVNPHTKGISSYHHAYFTSHPSCLTHLSLGIGQTGMVIGSANPLLVQGVRHRLAKLSIATIDDGRPLYSGEDEAHHLRLVIAMPYRIGDIGAKEALLVEGIARTELQHPHNILYDLCGSCSCES